MTNDFLIVAVVLMMAVAYAAWRVYRVICGKNNPCERCHRKANCKKQTAKEKKQTAKEKKH